MAKSYYVLEMFVEPGGSREALTFITSDKAQLKQAFEKMIRSSFNLYHLVFYGQDIYLSAYETGEQVAKIHLLPRVSVTLHNPGPAGLPDTLNIRFESVDDFQILDPEGNELDVESERYEEAWEALMEHFFAEDVAYKKDFEVAVDFDWDQELVELSGDRLSADAEEEVVYYSHYSEESVTGFAGVEETESGEAYGFEEFLGMVR